MEKEVVLIVNTKGPLYINFEGAFPVNKWANPKGKIYLTEREWDWVQVNVGHLLGNKLLVEGQEPDEEQAETEVDASIFKLNTNKAKAKIRRMTDIDEINGLIDYANDNEIENKIVDALVQRYNELSE